MPTRKLQPSAIKNRAQSASKGAKDARSAEEPSRTIRERKPPKEVHMQKGEESSCSSEESELCEITHEEPIDIDQYQYSTGAKIRMKNAISGEKGTLERNRYIGKHRSSKAIKIICDPANRNMIYRDQVREKTQEALYDMGGQEEV